MPAQDTQGIAADTRASTNAWNNQYIVAEHRNESAPGGNYDHSNPISLERANSSKEKRKIEDGKKRATTTLANFDQVFFSDPAKAPETPKPPKLKVKSRTT